MNTPANSKQTVYSALLGYLHDRHFIQGDQLPPERQLANELNVSRSRLRTCLAKLERDGLIWRRVGQGTFVSGVLGVEKANSVGSNIHMLETNPSEILETRLALEPQIAYIAAQRATGSDVDRITQILDNSEKEESWIEWGELDKAFHRAIAEASSNQLFVTIMTTIQSSQNERNWGKLSDSPAAMARRSGILLEHRAIIHAIQAREAQEAAAQMRRHLEGVREALLGPFAIR